LLKIFDGWEMESGFAVVESHTPAARPGPATRVFTGGRAGAGPSKLGSRSGGREAALVIHIYFFLPQKGDQRQEKKKKKEKKKTVVWGEIGKISLHPPVCC
jgi:hypothetical protein